MNDDQGGAQANALAGLELVPLPGSERLEAGGVQPAAAPLPADVDIDATLVLRRRAAVPDSALSGPGLTPAELADAYGADPGDLAKVTARLGELGVQVVSADAASRSVHVRGPLSLMEQVFGTSLRPVEHQGPAGNVSNHRVRSGGLSVPADLSGIVTGVLGLDNRPQTRALYQVAHSAAVNVSYTPLELGTVYAFPDGTDGTGQTIAIIELGGGFADSDLQTYFSGLGLTAPSVTAVGVDGAENNPGQDPEGADGEVLLDIEVAGALAPKADIVVYFAPNTDAGFLNAVTTAAHATPTPAAISISWGQGENQWTAQARTAMDQAFIDAAALGVTVTAAAGDDGSTDRETDGAVHVDFPAASPHVLACGGTSLRADTGTGQVTSETVWNNGTGKGATGGGFSTTFDRPSWQDAALGSGAALGSTALGAGAVGSQAPGSAAPGSGAPVSGAAGSGPVGSGAAGSGPVGSGAAVSDAAPTTGRGVPDVAGDADPQTGYQVLIDGSPGVIGGTSAVAPLWAALVARLAQANGAKFGLIQPALYAGAQAGTVAPGFRDVTEGDNGAYTAGPGWDACTGLGVPVGTQLVTVVATPT